METIAPLFWVGRGETTIALNCSYELAGGEACTELLVDVVEEEGHDGTLSGEDLKKSLGAFLSTVGPFPAPPPPSPVVFIASEDVLALLATAGALTVVGAGVEKLKGDARMSAAALDTTCCVVVVEASWCDAAAGGGAEKLNICVEETEEVGGGGGGAPKENTCVGAGVGAEEEERGVATGAAPNENVTGGGTLDDTLLPCPCPCCCCCCREVPHAGQEVV